MNMTSAANSPAPLADEKRSQYCKNAICYVRSTCDGIQKLQRYWTMINKSRFYIQMYIVMSLSR